MKARIRLGMVGGGQGAFIGAVHRIAARMDDRYQLVAGVFSSDPQNNTTSAHKLLDQPCRCYRSIDQMIYQEEQRSDGIEAIAIVTPNFLHFDNAKAALQAGIAVICEKPMTLTLPQARTLHQIAVETGTPFLLTHNYCGYPLVHEARHLIKTGQLGELRLVNVEYAQEWLTESADAANKQAAWRLDKSRAGNAGCLGDIGTHAYQLSQFITGLKLVGVSADLSTFVPGRQLDDNVHALLRFEGGAKGILWASQVAPGHENGLRIRVVGDKASLEWAQEQPDQLWFCPLGQPRQRITRSQNLSSQAALVNQRIPAGHPEGYLEAFANLYRGFAEQIENAATPPPSGAWLPDSNIGLEGMGFIDAVLRSDQQDGAWVSPEYHLAARSTEDPTGNTKPIIESDNTARGIML